MSWFRKDPKPANPLKALESGWQFYSRPTALEKPGTIFRIDKRDGKRFIVDTLDIKTEVGEEASGKSTESLNIDLGVAFRIFGIQGLDINLNTKINNMYKLTFQLKDPEREITTDVEKDESLKNIWTKLTYNDDSRYFIIRETRKGSGMTYYLSKSQIDQLGGEINIKKGLSLNGNLLKLKAANEYKMEGKFKSPLRVMFLAEELKLKSANLGGNKIDFGTVPVSEQLNWIDG